IELSIGPGCERNRCHAVADRNARHAFADGNHIAGAVGERNALGCNLTPEITTVEYADVAIVECRGASSYDDLTGSRHRIGTLRQRERIETFLVPHLISANLSASLARPIPRCRQAHDRQTRHTGGYGAQGVSSRNLAHSTCFFIDA